MPRTFQRTFASTLALGTLIAAALACNFPGISQSSNQTLTAAANLLATVNVNATQTAIAQGNALSMTQTALIPTSISTGTAPSTASSDLSLGTPQATSPATVAPLPPGVTPTQTSVALGSLKIGVEALVSTTAGSTLNLRDTAGKNGKVIAQMPSDTRVKIIDGPQAADGSLWWNVQVLTSGSTTAIGKTGWCSEFDGKLQTLTAAT